MLAQTLGNVEMYIILLQSLVRASSSHSTGYVSVLIWVFHNGTKSQAACDAMPKCLDGRIGQSSTGN